MVKAVLVTVAALFVVLLTANEAEAAEDVNAYFPKQLCSAEGEPVVRFAVSNRVDTKHDVRWTVSHNLTKGGYHFFKDGKFIMKYVVAAGENVRINVWMDEPDDQRLILSGTIVANDCAQ